MSCPTYLRLLSRWLDGELACGELAPLEAHLSACENCRETMEAWRLPGTLLRAFLRGHSLGEGFVRGVRAARQKISLAAIPTPKEPRPPERRGWIQGNRWGWIQVAASLLIATLLLVHFLPSPEGLALGRVVAAGESLEVRSARARAWVPASLGSTLRSGDWVRNPEPVAAQLLLNDSWRITLEQGALAQLQGSADNRGNQLVLADGSLVTEGKPGADEIVVRTAAGRISGQGGRFSASAGSVTLPRLEVRSDGSELVKGTIEDFSRVRVLEGSVRVATEMAQREVSAGSFAYFTSSLIARASPAEAEADEVEASLLIESYPESAQGVLLSSLVWTHRGPRLRLEAQRMSLARLMEWVADSRVRGGDEIQITGRLEYMPECRREALVAAVGRSLGLNMALRQEATDQDVTLSEAPSSSSTGSGLRGFEIRKSGKGFVSFDFHAVPASEVFRALRSEEAVLPLLSPGSEAVALTLRGESLRPAEIAAWLEGRLAWRRRKAERAAHVVEIHGAFKLDNAGSDAQSESERRSSATRSPSPIATPAVEGASFDALESGSLGAPSLFQRELSDGVLRRGSPPSVKFPDPRGAVKGVVDVNLGTGDSGLTVTVKLSRKSAEDVEDLHAPAKSGRASRLLIWPAFVSAADSGAVEAYSVHNPHRQSAQTTWFGYDSGGRLTAWYEMELAAGSTVTLFPARDLVAALDEGAHWETVSDLPLVSGGTDADGARTSEYGASYREHLPRVWEFEAAKFLGAGGDSRLWLINPGDIPTLAVLAVVDGDRALFSQEILLAPHAGLLWRAGDLAPHHPELERSPAGSRVLIQAASGSIVAGTRTVGRAQGKEIVMEVDPAH